MHRPSEVGGSRLSTTLILSLTAVVAASLIPGCATAPQQEKQLPEPVVDARAVDPWRQDLATFERELPRRHYDLFYELSRERASAFSTISW